MQNTARKKRRPICFPEGQDPGIRIAPLPRTNEVDPRTCPGDSIMMTRILIASLISAALAAAAFTGSKLIRESFADETTAEKAESAAKDAQTGAKKTTRKAKKKTRDATGNQNVAKDAGDSAENAADDVKKSAEETKNKVD